MLIRKAFKKLHVGRRGACLIAIGYLEFIYGLAMVAEPNFRARPGIDVATTVLPGVVWGYLWVIFGTLAILGAFLPTGYDRHGFRAAYPMPVIWGTNYLVSVLLGEYANGWIAGLAVSSIWYGYAFLILAVSGMIGVEDLRRRK
jgi:hypothetical protein